MQGLSPWIVKEFAKASKAVLDLNKGMLSVQRPVLRPYVTSLLQSGSPALLYVFASIRPNHFEMPFSEFTFVLSAVEGIISSFGILRDSLHSKAIKSLFEIRNLFECVEWKSSVSVRENFVPYERNSGGMKIEARNLCFSYGDTPVLKNVSFVVEPGEIVGIVGANGSGKTTLIRLLTLNEVPTQGEIYINDINISEYDPAVLRKYMSILFQDFRTAFNALSLILEIVPGLSVRENISFGKLDEKQDLKLVKKAALNSGAYNFIRKLRSHFNTLLLNQELPNHSLDGNRHYLQYINNTDDEIPFMCKILTDSLHVQEKYQGKHICFTAKRSNKTTDQPESTFTEKLHSQCVSGGEAQKIALARTFNGSEDVDLMILDEPSSALDPQSQYQLFGNIRDFRNGKTTMYTVLHSYCQADIVSSIKTCPGSDKNYGSCV
jgi:ABC-type multidrug transport system fused ATPase/permease subunit